MNHIDFLFRRLKIALASPARLLSAATREEIELQAYQQAKLTTSYGFMLFAACGIAALGLLQSSAAVVIGAMLISPLMGPIIAMGVALARVDPRAFRSAASTLLIGAALSVGAAVLIVWMVPLKDPTAEILARTRPTLLDLIVAMLSGFVGAYLAINRKPGELAGVAIATALMPPLATVGYGLATANWSYAGGAFFLFVTNVVAILASVFVVARRYGFQPKRRKGRAWEVWALWAVMLLLAVPLALSLRDMVVEARETNRVRVAILKAFEGAQPHITELVVQAEAGQPRVQSVVIARRYVSDAARKVAGSLGGGAAVVIEQVVAADGLPKPDPAGAALGNRALAVRPLAVSPEERLRAMLAESGRVLDVRRNDQGLEVDFALPAGATLEDYKAIEQSIQRLTPDLSVILHPPLQPLPPVAFGSGSTQLDEAGREAVGAQVWALKRWGAASVVVEGRSSVGPRGPVKRDLRIALARAEAVAERIRELGVTQVRTTSRTIDAKGDEQAIAQSAQVSIAAN